MARLSFSRAVLLVWLTLTSSATAAIFESIGSPSGNRDNFSGTVGTRFTVGSSDLTIDALGYQDPDGDGLVTDHRVGIWRVSDSQILGSVTVPAGTSAILQDGWRYEGLGVGITLQAGETYALGAETFSGSGDGWTDANDVGGSGVVEFALGAGVLDANPTNNFVAGQFGFPANDGTLADLRWAPANADLLFNSPPPMVDVAIDTLGDPIGNRDNFTGTVGTAFTLAADTVFNALGYQDPGGDGLMTDHTVGLWRVSDGALLASAVVPAGSSALLQDGYRYSMLASDLALEAGETYAIGAEVFSGSGDGWTDANGAGGSGMVEFALTPGVLDADPTNRFLPGGFGFPGNDGTLADLRWAPANVAFISQVIPEPATVSLWALSFAALGCRRRRSL